MYRWLISSSLLASTLAGCILTTSAGGYPANGQVVDKQSGTPIEGVRVRLKYSTDSPYGRHDKYSERVVSNTQGAFHIPAEEIQLWGGSGGLAGRINEWPAVELSKRGYCEQTFSFSEPGVATYQDMILELEADTGDNCAA